MPLMKCTEIKDSPLVPEIELRLEEGGDPEELEAATGHNKARGGVMVKVFKMNDCDWCAGEDAESCKQAVIDFYGEPTETYDQPRELTEQELDSLKLYDEETDTRRTFRDVLDEYIREGAHFPVFFASTEY